MYNFFNPKRKRIIAGVIAGLLVVSMLVTGLVSVLS